MSWRNGCPTACIVSIEKMGREEEGGEGGEEERRVCCAGRLCC